MQNTQRRSRSPTTSLPLTSQRTMSLTIRHVGRNTTENHQKNAFRTKQTFSRIRTVQQNNTRTAITYVEHTNDDNIDVECFYGEAIDAACIQEGIQRYSQAQDTPFLTSPLLEDFGFLGKQTTIEAVLNGTYVCPPEVDNYTHKIIHELRRPLLIDHEASINGVATTAEHIQGWKKMRSSTAASTFGPSFSDLIAATDDLRIAEVDASIVSIPARTGYCPRRWSDAVDVMIPKKAASTHVEKLRIIVLFHALFNMLNKRVAKKN
jgi:hypothetical protein